MTPVRLEPAALRSRVKHSTTEPLRSLLVRTLGVVVMGTTGIKDTNTASLYELAFTATHSVSGQSFEVAWLVAGWVTQALEQGQLGSWAHASYHQYYIVVHGQN